MERLSALRRAQLGGKRAPHKPLLLLWLFGRFAATGSALVSYAEAADPVSQLINDFGPPVTSPALERQRAAMPFVHLERDLWELRDRNGDAIGADVPEERDGSLIMAPSASSGPRSPLFLPTARHWLQPRGCSWTSISRPS